MMHFIVPALFIFLFWVYLKVAKVKARRPATFQSHVAEIRDLIHKCDNESEWWTLDREIDWLDETWKNLVPNELLLQETGKLYDKWFKQRDLIKRKTA